MRTLLIGISLLASACAVHVANSCADGALDGNETDLDCGGSCQACGVGRHCIGVSDCASGACVIGVCAAPSTNRCADGVRDGDESDVDCGGSCVPCSGGRRCQTYFDCASGMCSGGICAAATTAPTCSDGFRNGSETDVDCGGGSCSACIDGLRCLQASDCQSGTCTAGRCVTPSTGGLPNAGNAQVYVIDAGAGVVIMPGVQPGYGVTANVGGSYRIVWTGDVAASGTYREFYGSVWTTGGFTNFVPGCTDGACALESDDYVSPPYTVAGGVRIDFDTFATDGIDGFDVVALSEPVYFDLYIDGQHQSQLVFFSSGGQQSSPISVPFGLTVQ